MRVKVLGTQSPFCTTLKSSCPGFLIDDGENKIVLDCGSGAHKYLNLQKDLNNMHIFLSHLHRDHYNDVYILQYASYTLHNLGKVKEKINIYLPKTPSSIHSDIVSEVNAYANYFSIDENKVITIGNTVISFCKTDHPVETYAIKVSNGNETIVYTSDTSFSAKDRIVEFAKDVDLLICESSLLKEYGFPKINSHLTAEQAGIIAKEANVKKLVLTHFWPEEKPIKFVKEAREIFQNVVAAKEGKIINVSKYYKIADRLKTFFNI